MQFSAILLTLLSRPMRRNALPSLMIKGRPVARVSMKVYCARAKRHLAWVKLHEREEEARGGAGRGGATRLADPNKKCKQQCESEEGRKEKVTQRKKNESYIANHPAESYKPPQIQSALSSETNTNTGSASIGHGGSGERSASLPFR